MKDLTDWVYEREDGFAIDNGVVESGDTVAFYHGGKQMMGVVGRVFGLVAKLEEVVEL